MVLEGSERSLIVAVSMEQALAARRDGATILAGGTWLMRDPRGGRALPETLLSLHAIPGLRGIDIDPDRIAIGAAVTHDALAASLKGVAGLDAVVSAASGAANPAIRRVATVGGNLCSTEFAAADLLPAFLAFDARVELQTADGLSTLSLPDFLVGRSEILHAAILTRVILARDVAASAHARLPLRRAGDYPVAIVSVARATNGRVRIAVGSVEETGRRWTSLENALSEPESHADDAWIAALATQYNDFQGRDGIEAEGWYRAQVLPSVLGRAMKALRSNEAAKGGAA